MTTEIDKRVGSEFVSIQPSDDEILTAFFLESTIGDHEEPQKAQFPADEERLAEGITVAAGKAPFLGRFVESGRLTESVQDFLDRMVLEGILIRDSENFRVTSGKVTLDLLTSIVRTMFKEQGIKVLREGVQAAQNLWSGKSA